MMVAIKKVQARSVLNKSKIFDYCLNPYTGCQHNCRYCYARLFMKRYSGHKEEWGEFVDAKVNAPNLLEQQLSRAKKGTVWVSSVCDPYQPIEEEFRLTRECLKVLAASHFPVNIQTKSALILRDLDLLMKFRDIQVGFTITTDDENIAGLFEPGAPPVAARLEALKKIHESGISTFVFIGPLLPGNPERLAGKLAGNADHVYIDKMNYMNSIMRFYIQNNLEQAASGVFFREQKKRLITELRKQNMNFEFFF